MKDIWDYLKGLFQQEEQSSPSNPYIHELISRPEAEKEAFAGWKGSLEHRRLVDWLLDQYAIWQSFPQQADPAVDFLNTASSKGFVVYLHKTSYSRQEATWLLDFLKEQVLLLHYKVQVSDTRTWTQKAGVETVERHYLKPRMSPPVAEKCDQRYGNITVELSLRNDLPRLLKFQATTYRDQLYTEALHFRDLMHAVLTL
jgi:hypothetical protein